jgi:hypothetical protein
MDQGEIMGLVLAAGWVGITLLWNSLLRGAALTILLLTLIIYSGVTLINPTAGIIGAAISWAAFLIITLMRIVIIPKYSFSNSAFETNQIIRGLSPTEAGFFTGLTTDELLIVTILHLADKGIIELEGKDYQTIRLTKEIQNSNRILSNEERYKARNKAARKFNQILLSYEHTLIELLPKDGTMQLSDLDGEIWYRDFSTRLERYAQAHDLDQTREYAEKMTHRMTEPGSKYAERNQYFSGWYAVQYFYSKQTKIKIHRPEWMRPDDDLLHLLAAWENLLSAG